MVKSIVEAHRGNVEVKDEVPHGLCIDIRIPKHLGFSPLSSSNTQNSETN